MSIEKVMNNIAADRNQIEAHLEELANVAPLPLKVASQPGDNVNSFLMSVVAGQFADAAARLNAMSCGQQSASAVASEGKKTASDVVDVTDYGELPDETS
jgi:uncharacterized protein YceH (UPF0502 family)